MLDLLTFLCFCPSRFLFFSNGCFFSTTIILILSRCYTQSYSNQQEFQSIGSASNIRTAVQWKRLDSPHPRNQLRGHREAANLTFPMSWRARPTQTFLPHCSLSFLRTEDAHSWDTLLTIFFTRFTFFLLCESRCTSKTAANLVVFPVSMACYSSASN